MSGRRGPPTARGPSDMAVLYARVAADPAGRQVLADIMQDLAGGVVEDQSWRRYAEGGQAHDAVGEVARGRAAARIDRMIRSGRS